MKQLLVIGLISLSINLCQGQPTPPPPSSSNSTSANLFAGLNLSDEQMQEINAVFKEVNTRLHDIMNDPSFTKEEKIAKAKVLEKARFMAINKILTPEQQAKLKAAQDQMKSSMLQKPGM